MNIPVTGERIMLSVWSKAKQRGIEKGTGVGTEETVILAPS